MINATSVKVAGTAQGRKYGYLIRNALSPNRLGNRSAGFEREPPIKGPRTPPVDCERDRKLYVLQFANYLDVPRLSACRHRRRRD